MTTRINVNVDQQALLQRSQEQTQANRLAFLEGQNRSRAGKEAERQRNANRAARGLTADGSMYNNRLRQLPQRPEPAAYRLSNIVDLSIGWLFTRVKEQPLFWQHALSNSAPCGNVFDYGRTTIKHFSTYVVRSGSGNTEQSFDTGYDISNYFSRPGPGTDLGGSASPAITYQLGATNSSGDRFKQTGWQAWLPVGPGLLVYALRYRRIDAIQLITQQDFVPDCNSPTVTLRNFYGLTSPVVVETTVERCFLVGPTVVKPLQLPAQLRNKLETTQRQWAVTASTRSIATESLTYYNGDPNSALVEAFAWRSTAPTASLATVLSGASRRYTVTQPLPNNFFAGSYVLATAGVYETLIGDPATDYDGYALLAPLMTNINDSTGFGSGSTWTEIYANAGAFKHKPEISTEKYKARPLSMSSMRLPAPSDVLSYTDQSGVSLTSAWSPTAAIGYDWRNQVYCRQQLSLLGFTKADLTP